MGGRMRELAVQSASDTVSGNDRDSIDLEFEQLKSEIDRIAKGTSYNGMGLIDGSAASDDITLQVGADNNSQDQLSFNLADFRVTDTDGSTAITTFAGASLTTDGSTGTNFKALDLATSANSQTAITSLDEAIEARENKKKTEYSEKK